MYDQNRELLNYEYFPFTMASYHDIACDCWEMMPEDLRMYQF